MFEHSTYLGSSAKLFSDLYLTIFLNVLAKSFFRVAYLLCIRVMHHKIQYSNSGLFTPRYDERTSKTNEIAESAIMRIALARN